MDNRDALAIIQNVGPEVDEDTYLSAFQRLIDTGVIWALHGFFAKQAMELICSGRCRDTYNVIGGNPHAW